MMLDIVFCSLPYSDPDHIYPAPAILKGVAVQNGYSAKTIDFGGILLEMCNYDLNLFFKIDEQFISPRNTLSGIEQQIYEDFFDRMIQIFKDNPSKFIGLSALSIHTHKCIFLLCERLKKEKIQSKIIVGGRGILSTMFSILTEEFNLTAREKILKFGDLLKSRNLVDEAIYGDGEDAILTVLSGEKVTEEAIQNSDTFHYPVADYSDYNFNHYVFADNQIEIPITGSKGCVRNCDFCDIKRQFGKYRYRSGADVANEMISISKQYGFKKFRFTDSLVNGGYKPFLEFLNTLSSYNLSNPDKKITWTGQYICRPQTEVPYESYQLIVDSGGQGLTIGAESGSNYVLEKMNKRTTVDALYYELEQFRKHKITCNLLTFVGHWSEDHSHFVEHCRMLINLVPYFRSGTISKIQLGTTFLLLEGTPSYDHKDIIIGKNNPDFNWFYPENPTNTFKERVYRRLVVDKLAKRLSLPNTGETSVLGPLQAAIDEHINDINEFYSGLNLQNNNSDAKKCYVEFETFFEQLAKDTCPTLHIQLELEAQECNGNPDYTIEINNEIVYSAELPTGSHTVDIHYDYANSQEVNIKMSMSNKKKNDTIVDSNGNIISDKFILIKNFKINNFDVTADYKLFNTAFKYTDKTTNQVIPPKTGFWNNFTLETTISIPLVDWYNSFSNINSKPDELQAKENSKIEEKLLLSVEKILI